MLTLTGSLAKRSREAGKPNVTSDWFKYLAQCSKLPASANVYSLKKAKRIRMQKFKRTGR